MRELLKTKGLKMTAQRELVFRSFLESGRHVSVEELYDKVRAKDGSIGLSTVWRNLKLICKVGLAKEVNLGDGITRYDRITEEPHGHLFCLECRTYVEFDIHRMVGQADKVAEENGFEVEGYRFEVQGFCAQCLAKRSKKGKPRGKKRPGNATR